MKVKIDIPEDYQLHVSALNKCMEAIQDSGIDPPWEYEKLKFHTNRYYVSFLNGDVVEVTITKAGVVHAKFRPSDNEDESM